MRPVLYRHARWKSRKRKNELFISSVSFNMDSRNNGETQSTADARPLGDAMLAQSWTRWSNRIEREDMILAVWV